MPDAAKKMPKGPEDEQGSGSGLEAAFFAARSRVRAKMGWYRHLVYYLVVNLFLLGINLVANPRDPWFVWPLTLWGLAVFVHGAVVLVQGLKQSRGEAS